MSKSHTMLLNQHLRRLRQTISVAGRLPGTGPTFHAATLEKLARMTVAFRVSVAACQDEARVRVEAQAQVTMPIGQTSAHGFSSMEWRVQDIVEASFCAKASGGPSIFGTPATLLGREPEVQALIARASTIGVANSMEALGGECTNQGDNADWARGKAQVGQHQWGDNESEPASEPPSDVDDDSDGEFTHEDDDLDSDERRPLFRRRSSSHGMGPFRLLLAPPSREQDEARPRGRSRTRRSG